MALRNINPNEKRLALEREFIKGAGSHEVNFTCRLPEGLHHKLKELSLDSRKSLKELTIEAMMDLINNKYGKQ